MNDVESRFLFSTDTQPPRFTTCPKDIVVEATKSEIKVNWIRPTVVDDSHLPPIITSNYKNGGLFAVPGIYEVRIIAEDYDGNRSPCTFRITLKSKLMKELNDKMFEMC